jgi:Ca-activated chloride channel homolog
MSALSFSHPLVLLALVPVACGALLARRALPRVPFGRETLWRGLHALAPALLVLALAGPQLHSGSRRATVLAIDESASVDTAMRAVERHWAARVDKDGCVSPCRVIRFATTPAASSPSQAGAAGLGPGATDLQSAIGTAIGLAPHDGRVAVLSDGGQTQGEVLATTPLARARDVQVDWVPLSDPDLRDAAITAIGVPPVVHLGDTVPLTLTVHSSVAALAVLSVRASGAQAASETINLRAGDNPLLLLYTATKRGWQSFQATISLPGDTVGANNSLAAVTDVVAAPRVLVVGAGSAAPSLLQRAGLSVTQLQPAALPTSAGGYAGQDAVVLNDIPASQLSTAQIAALSGAVRSDGLGLVVLGGAHSFSLGGYARSPLQQLLPVSSLVPGNLQRRNLAIELVLDHSGSMIELAGGVQKIALARAAAIQSAAFLRAHQDALGIVDFDITSHTLVPLHLLTSAADERQVDHIVDGLEADGGTNIYLGLEGGLNALLASDVKERHMILLTDGISEPANYKPLLARARSNHISVATVALGAEADRSLLAEIAAGTGGHAYVTEKASELPKIFVKETQLSAKPVRVTGHLSVQLANDSPIVRSLIGKSLPSLRGNVVTQLKNGAQADLLASDAASKIDPALAQWQIGAGRVVAWTPGLDSDWAGDWLGESAVWNEAVRWTERGVAPSPLTPQALGGASDSLQIDLASAGTAALGVSAIEGTLTDVAGTSAVARPIQFEPVGPSLYDANVASWPPGVYRFALHTAGAVSQTATGELAIGYPAEYSPVTARVSPLAQLVAQTGGQVLPAGRPGALASPEHSLWRVLALAALVAFLAGVAGRMLSGQTKPSRSRASLQPRASERDEDEDEQQTAPLAQDQAPTPTG